MACELWHQGAARCNVFCHDLEAAEKTEGRPVVTSDTTECRPRPARAKHLTIGHLSYKMGYSISSCRQRISMPSRDELITTMWDLVEQLYRMESPKTKAGAYSAASDADKRAILTKFVKTQAVTSQRWASIALNLLSADLEP
jgi:hypothetical protein